MRTGRAEHSHEGSWQNIHTSREIQEMQQRFKPGTSRLVAQPIITLRHHILVGQPEPLCLGSA